MRLQFRQLALDDLDNIWDYSYSKWGPEQTERYVRDIYAACEELSQNLRFGLSAEQIRPGYRKYMIGQHVLYYKQDDGNLTVYRILHQSMDVNIRGFET